MDEPREITESFRLERVLKSSRSAIVFRAADPATDKVVAIKLIPPAGAGGLQASQARFLATMAAAAPLDSPGLPPIRDYGFTPDGSAFIVMDFVEGTRLEVPAGGEPERTLHLTLDVVKSLEALAARSVAHGNVRPDNVLVVRRGDEDGAVVLGFGTAAFQAATAAGDAATSFAAPERLDPATASREADWRADLYSLALTTCALLGAEVGPRDAAPSVALPPEVRQRLADPVVLRAILEQSLRRSPDARPASLAEFREAIELALEGVPGHEALTPELEAAAVIADDEPPAPTFEAEPAAPPQRERTGPVPIARLPEIPAPASPVAVLLAEPEVLPEAVEAAAHEPTTLPGAELLEPAPLEAAVAQAPEGGEAAPAAVAPAPPPRKRRPLRTLLLAVGAVGVVLLAAALFLVLQARRSAPPPRTAAAPTRPAARPVPATQPPAQPAAVLRLQNAEAAIALADLVAARQALDSITEGELEALSVAERERYASLRAAYDSKVQQTLTRELASSLASGNLKALAETVRGISREDEAGFARNDDLLAALEEARRALNVQQLMLKAQRDGDWAAVLQHATVVASLVPRYAPASEARERAAATLEREADSLAGKGNYEAALARLETVRRSWPGRSGLAAHVERIRADQATDQQLAAVLAGVDQAEKDKAPEKGLAALAAVTPPPRWQDRVRQAHDRLAAQLKQLDAASPTIALAQGVKLEYKKNEAGTISLRIQDDHGIKSARLFARTEGTSPYVELPLRPGAAGDYSAEVSPAFHKNTTIEFYVVATDFSDHATLLGSAQEPLKLKRKKWSLFG